MCMAACEKAERPAPVIVNTPLSVNAEVEGATRTTLVDGTKVYWTEGDKFVGIHTMGPSKETLNFTLTDGAGSKSATFESQVPHFDISEGDKLVGIYGCEMNGGLPVWPAQQLASQNGCSSSADISRVPMFAYSEADADGVFSKMYFRNGGGLFKIHVKDNIGGNAMKLEKVRIDSPTAISGEFNVPSFSTGMIPSFTFTGNAGKYITLTCDNNIVLNSDGEAVVNVAMPAGAYTGLKFTYIGKIGDIPFGYTRTMKSDSEITIHRSQIDEVTMDIYKEQPLRPDDPPGTVGGFADLKDPHHKGPRTGIVVGFDFSSGKPASTLIIGMQNVWLDNRDIEHDAMEAPWVVGNLVKYNVTNKFTSAHWRLMTVDEARAVIQTDETGTGIAMWGTMNGVEGIYWYFDPERYIEYGAEVVPNSIFLPTTHEENGEKFGRYWLDANWYFEFHKDPANQGRGIVTVIEDAKLKQSDHLGALRLVHDPTTNGMTI